MNYTLYVVVWIACAFASAWIARWWGARNLVSWFLLGLVAGPVGVMVAIAGAKGPEKE